MTHLTEAVKAVSLISDPELDTPKTEDFLRAHYGLDLAQAQTVIETEVEIRESKTADFFTV